MQRQERRFASMNRFVNFGLVCILGFGLSPFARASQGQTKPDNTTVNKRDETKPTADQQKNDRPDEQITRDIRRSIISDKSLSTYAKNIKIITQNGNVTLRGPVRSDQEKQTVEAKANEVAGADHVKSEIEIAAKQPSKKPW
jgi:hyperosmotically inducible protein